MIPSDIKELLDMEAARINSPSFISKDPVQFPRRFEDLRDIEIVALLSSTIAWGNRKMICANCEKMLSLMAHDPYAYLMDEGYEDLPDDGNIHRTFFNRHFKHWLRTLRAIYTRHGSLADFAIASGVPAAEAPAWALAESINRVMATIPATDPVASSRCLPQNLKTTALKRLNMALRWLVRDDGIVDMGVWRHVLTPAQLFIPLDVHVGDVARDLGLLHIASDNRRAVDALTALLRTLRPDDPVFYDYALFGLGLPPAP